MRKLSLLLVAFMMAACATARVQTTTNDVNAPPEGARILVMKPDVELSIMTMSGLQEPRADWTEAAQKEMTQTLHGDLEGRNHTLVAFDTEGALSEDEVQLLKLHEAVGHTIRTYKFGVLTLPTKKEVFDWSLGESVKEVGDRYNADYALFTFARASYASGGRQAMSFLAAAAGVGISTGYVGGFTSLVDLKTGDVVWFNVSGGGSGVNLRSEGGSATMIKAMLKDIPL